LLILQPKDKLYKLDKNKFVNYRTPMCDAVTEKQKSGSLPCEFKEEYVDSLEAEGYLVKDSIQGSALTFG
jgi:hypothetical protein